MVPIAIPDKFAAELQELALQDERPIEALVDDAIHSYLAHRFPDLPLASEHVCRLKQGMAEAENGELVSAEQVDAFFDGWEKDLVSK